ncbi:MAG: cellulose synthase subunit BcsC-related outer membrane protein [Acetobacteraceae bacterium]|nr:cellulose synthase subunit BcsC-related outer membrane protein [Acetobacteraceae bacterium]
MTRRLGWAAAVVAAALAGGPAAAQAPASPAIAALLAQGAHWAGQNRPDLALRAYERALAADPQNPEALAGAAQAEAALGNRAAAERLLGQLRALVPPGDPRLVSAERGIRVAITDRAALADARRLAQAGQAAAAVARYRELFGGRTPPEQFAVEYYLTLGGTPEGFAEAREGLAAFLRARPNDTRAELALAQLLTFRPETRAEGIARLRALVGIPSVSREAIAAWRQALLWAGASPAQIPALEGFLQQVPNDPQITRLLAEARTVPPPPGPGDEARIAAFAELERNRLREAAAGFEAAIARNPNDADALGGLGVVRLREGRAAEARALLERAIAADPRSAERWREALEGASYVAELADARAQMQRNELDRAETTLRRAVAREVPDRADAEAMLGDLLLRRGDPVAAEQRYRAALARRPDFGTALAGLERALRAQGRTAEAAEIARRLPGPPGSPGAGRAAALRAEAARQTDPATAAALLQTAIAADPANPWARLDLARLLRRQGRAGEARAIMDGAVAAAPSSPEALYAAALFADEDGRLFEAAELIQRIPPGRRSADMSRLLARARAQAEVASAAAGLPGVAARQQLLAIAARPDPTGATGAAVVRAFGAAGDARGAAEAARVALVGNRGTAARIALTGALIEAGALEAARAETQALLALPGLSAEERRQVLALQDGLAIRAADALNERGDQAAGFEQLRAILTRDPEDRAANLALARLYAGAGRAAEAQRVAEAVLARDRGDLEARAAAVDAAIAARDMRRAAALVEEGRALAPGDARVSLMEARVAQAAGDSRRAAAALQRAAEERAGGAAAVPTGLQNPFRTAPPAVAVAAGDRVAADIARELAAAREAAAPQLRLSAGIRTRSGSSGLDALTELSAEIEGRIPAGGLGGAFFARVTPVSLAAGELPGNLTEIRRFGGNALTGPPPGFGFSRAGSGSAQGVGLSLGYERPGFTADIGTTPLGFRVQNIVGGVEIAPQIAAGTRLRLTAERRAMTDSVLAWAGAFDPITGRTWGGAVRTGGRAQIEYTDGPFGFYVGGGYYRIDAREVPRNARIEAGAGASYAVWRSAEDELVVGADAVYFAYDRNLRHFTYSHGGYFSPQSFAALNFPVDYRARSGDLSWRIGATVGFSSWREDRAPFFPGSPSLQGLLQTQAISDPTLETHFPGRSTSGFGGQLRGDIEYRLRPNLSIGGLFRYDRAADWSETRALLFTRYRFD